MGLGCNDTPSCDTNERQNVTRERDSEDGNEGREEMRIFKNVYIRLSKH